MFCPSLYNRRKTKFLLILFLITGFISNLFGINIMLDESIQFRDNIFFDYTSLSDFINKFILNLSGKDIKKSYVLWWKVSAGAETYFSNDTESNYTGNAFIKYRRKFKSSVFDLSSTIYFNKYPEFSIGSVEDNSAYSHLYYDISALYRKDFDTSSFYIKYIFALKSFPDYNLDQFAHSGNLKYSFDLSMFTTIDAEIAFLYRNYSERYVMDSLGNALEDSFYDKEFSANLSMRHFFSPDTAFKISGFFNMLRSNGNFYFYGPNEATLIVDGDEALIDDFYSYNNFGGSLSISRRINKIKLILGLGYQIKNYLGREPFNSADENQTGEQEYNRITTLSFKIEWRLTENIKLNLSAAYNKNNSNNYKQSASSTSILSGMQIWF